MTWQRLSPRMVALDLVRVAVSVVPGYAGLVWLGGDGPVWPLVAASVVGVLGAAGDLVRYRTTTYRVTGTVVEMRSGWVARRHRSVALDLVRSVDVTAKLWHRPFRLRVVQVSSGEAESSFQLDAVDAEQAEALRRAVQPVAGRRAEGPGAGEGGTATRAARTDDAARNTVAGEAAPHGDVPGRVATDEPAGESAGREVVLARFRPGWVALNSVAVWSPLVALGPLVSLYWFLRPWGVDLVGLLPPAAWVAVVLPLGVAGTALTYLRQDGRYELVRAGSVLISRRRLLELRTVQLDEERIRGVALSEPMAWWWLRPARLTLVTTGPAGAILPSGRLRRTEALDLAARLLPAGTAGEAATPLGVGLRRHPRGALTRRLGWAVAAPLPAVAALAVWAPGAWWAAALGIAPVSLLLAVVAYRSLGHGWTTGHLVVRRGALHRRTVALEHRAVIGWTFRQGLLQRRGARTDVTVATAAGEKHYLVPDAGDTQAVALALGVTRELIEPFLERNTNVGTGR